MNLPLFAFGFTENLLSREKRLLFDEETPPSTDRVTEVAKSLKEAMRRLGPKASVNELRAAVAELATASADSIHAARDRTVAALDAILKENGETRERALPTGLSDRDTLLRIMTVAGFNTAAGPSIPETKENLFKIGLRYGELAAKIVNSGELLQGNARRNRVAARNALKDIACWVSEALPLEQALVKEGKLPETYIANAAYNGLHSRSLFLTASRMASQFRSVQSGDTVRARVDRGSHSVVKELAVEDGPAHLVGTKTGSAEPITNDPLFPAARGQKVQRPPPKKPKP